MNYTDSRGEFSIPELVTSLFIQGVVGAGISFAISYAYTRDVERSFIAAGTGFAVGVITGGMFKIVQYVIAARTIGAAGLMSGNIVIKESKITWIFSAASGKSNGFKMLGFNDANRELLKQTLANTRHLVDDATALISKTTTKYGTKYKVRAGIVGPNGTEGLIDVVWQVDKGQTAFNLVTAIAKPFKIIK